MNASIENARPTFDSRELRNAFGTFATGVTVITTSGIDKPVGLTANSFSSLSLDPPLVLWSLVKASPSLDVFENATHFGVSVLADHQEAVAMQFARPSEDKFKGIPTEKTECGVPLIEGAHSHFLCKREFAYDGGDHVIFVGRVLSLSVAEAPPLVFHRGAFTRISAAAA